MASNVYELRCPCCSGEIEVHGFRWDGDLVCCLCGAVLHFTFDMVVMEPDNEEWDVPELRPRQEGDPDPLPEGAWGRFWSELVPG